MKKLNEARGVILDCFEGADLWNYLIDDGGFLFDSLEELSYCLATYVHDCDFDWDEIINIFEKFGGEIGLMVLRNLRDGKHDT